MRRMLLVLLLVLAACSSGQAADNESAAASPDAPELSSPAPPAPAAPESSDRATTDLVDGSEAVPGAFEGSTETTSTSGFPDSNAQGVAYLTDVRVGRHPAFDRVVWEFDGDRPAYRAGYVPRPITEDGSGEPIEVRGDAVLQIIFTPASGTDLTGEDPQPVYQGPERLDAARAGAAVVEELVQTGDFEAALGWAVGIGRKAPFTVSELSDPTRVVIDIASQ
jgi:hypothetical protein